MEGANLRLCAAVASYQYFAIMIDFNTLPAALIETKIVLSKKLEEGLPIGNTAHSNDKNISEGVPLFPVLYNEKVLSISY